MLVLNVFLVLSMMLISSWLTIGWLLLSCVVVAALGVVPTLWLGLVGWLIGIINIGCLRGLAALEVDNLVLGLAEGDLEALLCANHVLFALGEALNLLSELLHLLLALSHFLLKLCDLSLECLDDLLIFLASLI